ncbi:DUF5994 family protein [Nocardia thraciensis]
MKRQKNPFGIGAHGPPGDRSLRLRLKTDTAKTGYVDGGWRPRSDNLTTELPALLAVLATRLAPIHRVAYHTGEWATAPTELVIAGRTVRLDGHPHGTAHTIEVSGARNHRLVLLVVPAYTDAGHAFATMMSAAATGSTSTVDELLSIGTQERADRTKRTAAVQRWKVGAAMNAGVPSH